MSTFRKTLIAAALTTGLGFAQSGIAEMTKAQVNAEQDRISNDFKAHKQKCDAFSGNAKDICMAEAKGNEKIAKAELDARRNDTAKNRRDVRVARADAKYDVAKERCDDLSGNTKDVCVKDAKSAHTAAIAEADADMRSGKAQARANERTADARADASQDKRKAEYAAARERCDAYSGAAKDQCVAEAKNRYQM
jgi:hypothetical protein